MAVAFDAKCAAAGAVFQGTGSPVDIPTFINVGSGNNRALVVGITFCGPGAIPPGLAVTWDQGGTNQVMTQIPGATANQTVATASACVLFGLIAPTSGNKTLRIAWTSGSNNIYVSAVSFTGVNQTGGATSFPHGTGNSNSGTASNPATVTVTSTASNAIVAIHVDNNTQTASSTSDNNVMLSSAGIGDVGSNYALGSGSSHALTCTYAAAVRWASAGTDVQAVATNLASAIGTGGATAVGIGITNSIAASTGAGAAAAIGASTAVSIAASAGAGALATIGASTAVSIAASAGAGAVAAIGASTAASVGAAAGVGAATAIGTAACIATAAGTGSAVAVGVGIFAAVGESIGVGGSVVIGGFTVASAGAAAGIGTAVAIGTGANAAVGAADGIGAAQAAGTGLNAAAGVSAGVGTATATGNTIATFAGTAAGIGAASFLATGINAVVGLAAGIGAAVGGGALVNAAVGAAAGTGSVLGISNPGVGVGTASGAGAAVGVGSSPVARAAAIGTGAAAGVGNLIGTSVGAATGTGVASALALSANVGAGIGSAAAVGTAAALSSAPVLVAVRSILEHRNHVAGTRVRYTVDYSDWLETGARITGASAFLSSSTAIADGILIQPTYIQFFLDGGVVGEELIVSLTVSDSLDQIKIDTVKFTVIASRPHTAKHPAGTRIRYTVDYSDWLEPGARVAMTNVTSSSPTAIVDTVSSQPTRVQFFLDGGVVGEEPIVSVAMNDSLGQTKLDTTQFLVVPL